MRGLVIAANQDPALERVFSTFAANTPQLYLDIDREKAQTLGVDRRDVFTALQATLGGYYVNDFNLFGRTWQVNIQGEASDRSRIDDIYRIHVRNSNGEMVPIRAFAERRADPRAAVDHPLQQLPQRHHQRRTGARALLRRGARRHGEGLGGDLAAGFGFEWTGTALQEKEAAGKTTIVLGLAVLFAYLFLVALYESWTIPIAVLLSVTVGVLGAMIALLALRARQRPLCPDRPRGADRARRQERHPDRRVRQGAARARACRSRTPPSTARALRFRAVMMTSFAFILGLVPLVIASGAGEASRRGVGDRRLRRHARRVGDRHLRDPDALRRLPAAAREP